MEFKLGKVYSFENRLGKIITEQEEYIFNEDDLEVKNIKKGDIVKFRPETVNDINRAFFVTKVDEMIYNSQEGIKRVIKSGK